MNYVMVVPQPRGQITLPKVFRDKYGIKPGVPVKVIDADGGIRVETLKEGNVIKPKYTPEEFKQVLAEISDYIKKYGPLWTKTDDKRRQESEKKERLKWQRLNW